MSKPQTVEELIERYDTDPLFHSIVNQVNSGWTDDDGVAHEGPSVFSARKASEIMSAVQPVIDALTAERDGYKRWAGEFDRRHTDALAERDALLDDVGDHVRVVASLTAERDHYRTIAVESERARDLQGQHSARRITELDAENDQLSRAADELACKASTVAAMIPYIGSYDGEMLDLLARYGDELEVLATPLIDGTILDTCDSHPDGSFSGDGNGDWICDACAAIGQEDK